MSRCPACLRVVLATPHLTDDRKCDGVTFEGAVDGFVPVPNEHAVDFSSGGPVIVPAPHIVRWMVGPIGMLPVMSDDDPAVELARFRSAGCTCELWLYTAHTPETRPGHNVGCKVHLADCAASGHALGILERLPEGPVHCSVCGVLSDEAAATAKRVIMPPAQGQAPVVTDRHLHSIELDPDALALVAAGAV